MSAPAPYDITQPSAKVFISTSLSWRNQVAFVGRRQRENRFISPDARPIYPRVRNDLDPPQDLFFRISGGAHRFWGLTHAAGRSRSEPRCQKKSSKRPLSLLQRTAMSRLMLFGKRSLRRALQQYVAHYHEEENLILFPKQTEARRKKEGAVRCRERLGGLLKYLRERGGVRVSASQQFQAKGFYVAGFLSLILTVKLTEMKQWSWWRVLLPL